MKNPFSYITVGLLLLPAAAIAGDAAAELEMFSNAAFDITAATAAPAAEEKKTVAFSAKAVSVLRDVITSTGHPLSSISSAT